MELSRLLNRWLRSDDRNAHEGASPAKQTDAAAGETEPKPRTDPRHDPVSPPWLAPYLTWISSSLRKVRILDMTESLPLDRLYLPVHLVTPSNAGPHVSATDDRFTDVEEQVRVDSNWREPAGRIYAGPEQALAEKRRVALVGDPGAGKTTMLRFLALSLASGAAESLPPLPLVVDLHALGRSPLWDELPTEKMIVAWLAGEIERVSTTTGEERPVARSYRDPRSRAGGPVSDGLRNSPLREEIIGWLEGVLERGEAVVLLDGLDEVAGATRGEHGPFFEVAHALALLAEQYPAAYILFTCRRGHFGRYLSAPKNYTMLETGAFEWEHVQRFIDVWFRHSAETRAALRSQLERNTRIRGLAANPLLLALICIIFQRLSLIHI